MKKIVVLGVNGQDGSFLAEKLIRNGETVIGVGRQKNIRRELKNLPITYVQLDLIDVLKYESFLSHYKPDIIYHVAAVHGSSGFNYELKWKSVHAVNTSIVHASLEYLRRSKTNPEIIYFGSAKMFGDLTGRTINEQSDLISSCIYSITKNSAANLLKYYRKKHRSKVSILWLFNHESPRRDISYFIPTIINILCEAKNNLNYKKQIYSLDFWCDWGSAEEYMGLIANNHQKIIGEDFIIATGKTLWARNFVKKLFEIYGLNYLNHVNVKNTNFEINGSLWKADITKLLNISNDFPKRSILDVCNEIISLKNYKS